MKMFTLNKANDLINSLNTLNDLRRNVFSFPYPNITYRKKSRLSFHYKNTCISFASLDEQTQSELKESILNIIDKRSREIYEEIINL